MTRREFYIGSDFNLWKVKQEAAKLAARAQKKGLSGGYTLTTETRVREVNGIPTEFDVLIVEGEPVRYDGWQFVAVVGYENGLPVVTGSPWYEGPQVDRSALKPGYCDHCQTERRRNNTIIVENEAGERKQVGSSCVKDFLGNEVNGAWYSTKDPFAALDGYAGRGRPMASFADVLFWTSVVVHRNGWVSRAAAEIDGKTATASDVRFVMGRRPLPYRGDDSLGRLWDEIRDSADQQRDMAAAERAFAAGKAIEGDSDYALNVQAVFATDEPLAKAFFSEDRFGLVVSVAGLMLKKEGEAAKAEREAAIGEITEALYAQPKERFSVTAATVVRVRGFETDYGYSEIITLVGDAHRFTWMTSSGPGLEEGDVIDFTATVKGEDTFNNEVSTRVLRLKVTKEYKEEAA